MLKLKLQYFGHLMWRAKSLEKTPMLWTIEGRRRRGWQRIRWLDGIRTQWTSVYVNSGSWWWTGRPGVLRFMGLRRVGHDWATELNWYFGHLMRTTDSLGKILMLGKLEGRRRRGRQRMKWLDGITVWMDMSLNKLQAWWWTGKPSVLQSVGSQRVRHDWAMNWNDLNFILSGVISPLFSHSILGTYQPGNFIFQFPIFFAFSYCLWCSQGKNN